MPGVQPRTKKSFRFSIAVDVAMISGCDAAERAITDFGSIRGCVILVMPVAIGTLFEGVRECLAKGC